MRKLHRIRSAGFSLVEITLALGVAGFALTAIVGLLSLTLRNSRTAMDDTLLAEMSEDLVNSFRKQNFNTLNLTPKIYFDVSGKRLNGVDGSGAFQTLAVTTALANGAVYQCTPVFTADNGTLALDGSPNLWTTTLSFSWPVSSSSASPDHKTIHAEIARY